jgi:hypothetical protein
MLVGFRYSPRLVAWCCWEMLAGASPVALHDKLSEGVSPLIQQSKIPAESTLRLWIFRLSQSHLQRLVHLTLSFIARVDADLSVKALRLLAKPYAIAPQLPAPKEKRRERVGRVLRACIALSACQRNGLFRRRPHQLRDWAVWLFRQCGQTLCRSP